MRLLFRAPRGRAVLLACACWALMALGRGESLTIATYNLENYGLANRLTADGYREEYPKPEEEKRALRRVILALRADVLAIQEIGGTAHLEELRRDLRREGLDYPHALLVAGPDPDRQVALLSQRPIVSSVRHADLPFTYFGQTERVKRGLLEAHFATAAGDVAVFVVHLKSRFTDRADDPESALRRVGEATAVRDTIWRRSAPPDQARFLLLGDCNDERNSPTLERLMRRGRGRLALLLPAADSRGETWTHAYRKQDRYSRIDHIFVSPGLRPLVEHGRARIYDGPGVAQASDHRPVVVTLLLEPAARAPADRR